MYIRDCYKNLSKITFVESIFKLLNIIALITQKKKKEIIVELLK